MRKKGKKTKEGHANKDVNQLCLEKDKNKRAYFIPKEVYLRY